MRKACSGRSTAFPLLLVVVALTLALSTAFFGTTRRAAADPPQTIPSIPALFYATPLDPMPGQSEVHLAARVSVDFNRQFDPDTVTGDTFFLQKVGGSKVQGTFLFGINKPDISLIPAAPLEPDSTYRVTLTNDIKSHKSGYALKPLTWTFKTATSPNVLAKVPAPDATNVLVNATVRVVFDQDMDWATVKKDTFFLYELYTGETAATIEPDPDLRTVVLKPKAALNPCKTYRVTLTRNVRTKNGAPLPKAVTWMFSTAPALPPPPPSISFSDVHPGDPYYEAIIGLAARKIISGYQDGRFGPTDPVSRQQFAKMIVRTLGLPVSMNDHCDFKDVGKNQDSNDPLYPDKYVAVCADRGITVGWKPAEKLFAPYNHITRYQVISMVVRATEVVSLNIGTGTPPPGWGAWRGDPTHGANAAWAQYNGFLSGLDLSVNPYGDMTRGEVAQILHTLLEFMP